MHQRRNVIIAITAAVIGTAAQVLVPLIARQIIDNVIVAHTDSLWPWLVMLFAAAALTFVLAYVRRYRGGRLALGVQLELRNAIHDRLQHLDRATLSTLPTGQLVSRANSDSTLVQGLLNFLPLMTGNVLMMLLSLVVMFALSPLLALLALVIMPALFAVSFRLRQRVFPANWDAQQREGDLAQIVDEDVTGVRVVKAFGQEEARAQPAGRRRAAAVRLAHARHAAAGALPTAARGDPHLRAGRDPRAGRAARDPRQHHPRHVPGVLDLRRPVRRTGPPTRGGARRRPAGPRRRGADLPAASTCARRSPTPRTRSSSTTCAATCASRTCPSTSATAAGADRAVPAPRRRRAGRGRRGQRQRQVDAGRAALALPRPDRGRVLLDGHDLRGITLHSLRHAVGVAFEESFLFSESIRTNIAYGRPEATDAEVEAAARAAQAHEFVTATARRATTPSSASAA